MTTPLDMSLEDVIKKNNREKLRARGRARRGRGAGGSFNGGRGVVIGSVRRGPLGINARASAYSIRKPPHRMKNVQWQHDLFEDSLRASGISGIQIGTKLYVSNLDYGVTKEDIKELFSEIGDVKRFAIHYDKNGRPSGSAEVVYTRRSDAFAALKRYNNVLLDGKPMKIEMLGDNAEMPVSARINVTGTNGRNRRTVVLTRKFLHIILFHGHFGVFRGLNFKLVEWVSGAASGVSAPVVLSRCLFKEVIDQRHLVAPSLMKKASASSNICVFFLFLFN
uniref:RRM domain-containing protein n=1 Tax=Cucumis sativus TaxID=3659 RepID=A0A0A0L717_CUCSA